MRFSLHISGDTVLLSFIDGKVNYKSVRNKPVSVLLAAQKLINCWLANPWYFLFFIFFYFFIPTSSDETGLQN